MRLNDRAVCLCERLHAEAEALRGIVQTIDGGGTLIDLGVKTPGGLKAGRFLAEICLAGLGRVEIVPGALDIWRGPAVCVTTDQPVAACMASQYAGWQVIVGKFFAMGSGPMRAASGKEALFEKIGHREQVQAAVGVLETSKLPGQEVFAYLATACGIEPSALTLVVAPVTSQAGTVQVVARSIETALHKLSELGFDIHRVESGWGVAPLPPPAANELQGIGRTNDAILYGGEVTLWCRGDDDSLQAIGPQVPSVASSDHGLPFAQIFDRYDRDFYKIDPHLFSPAVITLVNLDTGRSFRFGKTMPDVLEQSFGCE